MATAETENLGSESDQAGKAAGACVMVLFGAAGDLTKRKLIPALFNLVKANLLSKDFAVLGVSVDDLTLEQFRTQVTGRRALTAPVRAPFSISTHLTSRIHAPKVPRR